MLRNAKGISALATTGRVPNAQETLRLRSRSSACRPTRFTVPIMPATLHLTTPDSPTPRAITVPTAWPEVSLAQFVALFAPAPDEARHLAEILAGLPAGTVGDLTLAAGQQLEQQLAFAADPAAVLALAPPAAGPNVGGSSFGAWLLAQQCLEAAPGRPWLASGAALLAIYRCEALHGMHSARKARACEAALLAAPVTESYAACRAVVDQLQALAEQFRPDESDAFDPTDAELEAGSEELSERFAHLFGMDAAAGGQLVHFESVLRQDATTVLAKLTLDGARAAYGRRLHQIQAASHASH